MQQIYEKPQKQKGLNVVQSKHPKGFLSETSNLQCKMQKDHNFNQSFINSFRSKPNSDPDSSTYIYMWGGFGQIWERELTWWICEVGLGRSERSCPDRERNGNENNGEGCEWFYIRVEITALLTASLVLVGAKPLGDVC